MWGNGVLFALFSGVVGLDQHLCDSLFGGFEQTQHCGAAGGLGFAGYGIRVCDRFGEVVFVDEEG